MNAYILDTVYISGFMCVCTTAHACGLTSHVCGGCQKKLNGDEGWRESETHWAGNGV